MVRGLELLRGVDLDMKLYYYGIILFAEGWKCQRFYPWSWLFV